MSNHAEGREEKSSILREHEKFWAFLILIAAIVGMSILASTFDPAKAGSANDLIAQAKMRIIDSAIAGLIAIAGMAAQALFRISSVDRINAEAQLEATRKLPVAPAPEPQPVEVVNTSEAPVPVATTEEPKPDAEELLLDQPEEELPEYARPDGAGR